MKTWLQKTSSQTHLFHCKYPHLWQFCLTSSLKCCCVLRCSTDTIKPNPVWRHQRIHPISQSKQRTVQYYKSGTKSVECLKKNKSHFSSPCFLHFRSLERKHGWVFSITCMALPPPTICKHQCSLRQHVNKLNDNHAEFSFSSKLIIVLQMKQVVDIIHCLLSDCSC